MHPINLKPVNQQVVVVFGASSGIGRATALQFADQKAQLVVVGRDHVALDSLVQEIQQKGAPVIAVNADAADYAQVQNVADQAMQHFGRIDSWIHVAGVGVFSKFIHLRPDEFQRVIQVNLMGAVHGAMAALPCLRANANGGALIQVSSVESYVGLPFQSAYASSKHGMRGYLDILRLELEHDNIPVSVTNIMPAVIDTPFYTNAKTKLGVKPRAMSPIYKPEQVADAIIEAAHTPKKDVIVGGAGYMLVWMKRLMPRLVNRIISNTAFDGQMTQDEKWDSAPSTLFGVTHDDRISIGLHTTEPKAKAA